MKIIKYNDTMYELLYDLIMSEGKDWEEYTVTKKNAYRQALKSSIVYLGIQGDQCIAYLRARDDDSFGLYIYDLLVRKNQRGHQYGKKLMDQLIDDYPSNIIYVMSDIDLYYESLGFIKEGTIFQVKK